jgi:indolepyruvate ferredoxin oxidoreductase alpha subunit
MVRLAYALSEKYDTPVLIRMTTRVCHSKSITEVDEGRTEVPVKPYTRQIGKYVSTPAVARRLRVKLAERLQALKACSEASPLNRAEMHKTDIGVICSGVCYFYAQEVFGDSASYLKLGMTYPMPESVIRDFCARCKTIYVIEENDPYIEEYVKTLGFSVRGKDLFPAWGEMTPDNLRRSLYGEAKPHPAYDASLAVSRPPALCAGCPHRGFFYEISRRKNVVVTGDIGCYTLGSAKPFNALDACVCMGASISMGHGAENIFSQSGSKNKVVTVLGDSTFFHSGMTSLLDTAYNGGSTVNVILDNRITGMTGHQENPGTGYTACGDPTYAVKIEDVARAFGFRHIRTINPNDLKEVRETLDEFLALDEPSVIVTRWPCALKKFSREDKAEFTDAYKSKLRVDPDKCVGCRMCMRAGCPALSIDPHTKKAVVDRMQCLGCDVCAQICPKQAIGREEK